MRFIKHPKIILLLIIILFLVVRLYKISQIPSSLYWDETSIIYNAYSITQDLRDEWGEFLPIHFRAFGEFKLPVYIYSAALLIPFFGLSELSVRLPAVIYSIGSILLIYLISLYLYKRQLVALVSSFLFSIFPWYFIFSRTGYEATAGLMFYLLGVYLFILSLKHPKFLLISFLSFSITLYSYNSFRITTPLTLFILSIFSFKNLLKNRLILFLSLSLIILSLAPILRLNKLDFGTSRFEAVRIKEISDFPKNYLSHFDPNFLFLSGDNNPRSQIPGMGQLYLWSAPFLLLGFYKLLRKPKYITLLSLMLLLIAPIPAAITKESPHALRSISAIPFYSIIIALGLVYFTDLLRNRWYILVFLTPFILSFGFYFFTFLNFYDSYSNFWQYGYNRFFKQYKDKLSEYDQVLITDFDAQPYIFALYNLKYNPKKFRAEVKFNPPDKWGISTVESFNKFKFGKVKYENIPLGKSLVVVRNDESLENQQIKDFIQNNGGGGGYFIYEINK